MVEVLNQKWTHGAPSMDLANAGVLLHVFDNTEQDEPWLPCAPPRWCSEFGDRLSATIVNQHLPNTFSNNGIPPAGMILSPELSKSFAATLPMEAR